MEDRNFEQRCAIKFFVKLGETGFETFNKLKLALGSMLCRDHKFSSGLKHFYWAVIPSKLIPALEDFQLQKLITIWK